GALRPRRRRAARCSRRARLSARERQAHLDREAAAAVRRVAGLDASAERARELGDQEEAEPDAGPAADVLALAAHERVEPPRRVLVARARTEVADLEARLRALALHPHAQAHRLAAVLERVGDQVAQDRLERRRVRLDRHGARRVDLQRDAGLRGARELRRLALRELREIEALEHEARASLRDARGLEHALDEL